MFIEANDLHGGTIGIVGTNVCATPGMRIRSGGAGRGLARGRGRGPIGRMATMRGLGAVDWNAVKKVKYYDGATGTEKLITDAEINKWTTGTNITRMFAENRMNTDMVIQAVRGYMMGGKQAVIDPSLIKRTEKGWWGTFWADYKRRMKESLGKFKWPAIGIGAIAAGIVGYGLYKRIRGPEKR